MHREAERCFRTSRIFPVVNAGRFDELVCPDGGAWAWEGIEYTVVQQELVGEAVVVDGDVEAEDACGECLAGSGFVV
jgi:hypothetical protein